MSNSVLTRRSFTAQSVTRLCNYYFLACFTAWGLFIKTGTTVGIALNFYQFCSYRLRRPERDQNRHQLPVGSCPLPPWRAQIDVELMISRITHCNHRPETQSHPSPLGRPTNGNSVSVREIASKASTSSIMRTLARSLECNLWWSDLHQQRDKDFPFFNCFGTSTKSNWRRWKVEQLASNFCN